MQQQSIPRAAENAAPAVAQSLPAAAPRVEAQQTERPPIVLPTNQTRNQITGQAPGSNLSPNQRLEDGLAEKKEWGYSFNPLNIVWLILIFIIVIIILYTTRPNMVTDLVNGERIINNNKLVLWTVIITIVIAVMAFVIMSLISRRADGQKVA